MAVGASTSGFVGGQVEILDYSAMGTLQRYRGRNKSEIQSARRLLGIRKNRALRIQLCRCTECSETGHSGRRRPEGPGGQTVEQREAPGCSKLSTHSGGQ